MPWFAPELEPLLAIATATLNEGSELIEANAGFLKLINAEGARRLVRGWRSSLSNRTSVPSCARKVVMTGKSTLD